MGICPNQAGTSGSVPLPLPYTKFLTRPEKDVDNKKPGIALTYIPALMSVPKEKRPTQILRELLDQSLRKYGKDPMRREYILQLKYQLAETEDERREYVEDMVSNWIREAEKSKGTLRHYHLLRALEAAKNFGLSSQIPRIRRMIQQSPIKNQDLHAIEIEIPIPREIIEHKLQNIIGHDGWEGALSRLGGYGPLSGKVERNQQFIEELSRQNPFRFLAGQMILDDDGLPLEFATDPSKIKEIQLIRYENYRILAIGILVFLILQNIWETYGPIPEHELERFFETSVISQEIARPVANAIIAFWEGRYDESAHMLAPRIEAIFRSLAQLLRIAIYKEPSGRDFGGVVPLSSVLGQLHGRFDESWRRYFKILFVHPLGLNLRNRIAHGLVTEVTPLEAALLVHAVCSLRLTQIVSKKNEA